jgi:hypothetical protein
MKTAEEIFNNLEGRESHLTAVAEGHMDDIKKRQYGITSANSRGTPEDKTRCIAAVWGGYRGMFEHQCFRKRGHGKDGLYCKQHAKGLEDHHG